VQIANVATDVCRLSMSARPARPHDSNPKDWRGLARALDFTADGARLLAVVDGSLVVWDAFTGGLLHEITGGIGHDRRGRTYQRIHGVRTIRSDRSGLHAAIGAGLWDIREGRLVRWVEAVRGASTVAFDDDERHVVTAGQYDGVSRCHIDTGTLL